MKAWPIRSDRVSLAVTETGAHLSDVTFALADGRSVTPMHTAPWEGEDLPADIPPILRVLRGDFLCAPFGDSNVIEGETRSHGLPANGTWQLEGQTGSSLDLNLDGAVMGANVAAHYEVRPGQTVVYQRHTIAGGRGQIPIGHHAMLRAEPPLTLGFGPRVWAATPADAPEKPPTGRSILAYPQEIADLARARLADGGSADLTTYPFAQAHEDVWMLAADRSKPFGWSAATSAGGGWVWFALKDPRILPSTVLWLSNGGRSYAPWLSRHRHVIGIEEVCSYFAAGHAASIAGNPLSARGIPTAVELEPDGRIVINYIFGIAPIPPGFGAVAEIRAEGEGIALLDGRGAAVHTAVDLPFLTSN